MTGKSNIVRVDTSDLNANQLRLYVRMLEEEIHDHISDKFKLANIVNMMETANNNDGGYDVSKDELQLLSRYNAIKSNTTTIKG